MPMHIVRCACDVRQVGASVGTATAFCGRGALHPQTLACHRRAVGVSSGPAHYTLLC